MPGYVAGELFRILINHPHAIIYVQRTSRFGEMVSSIDSDPEGDCFLKFTSFINYLLRIPGRLKNNIYINFMIIIKLNF